MKGHVLCRSCREEALTAKSEEAKDDTGHQTRTNHFNGRFSTKTSSPENGAAEGARQVAQCENNSGIIEILHLDTWC